MNARPGPRAEQPRTRSVISRVSVVIPHAGELRYLHRCLESAAAEPSVREVILVMRDGLPESLNLAGRFPQVRCVITPDLYGYGAAANRGAAQAEGSLLLILNDDTWITRGAIDTLAAFMADNPVVSACGPPLVFPDGRFQPSVFRDVGVRSAVEVCLAPILRGPLRRVRRHPCSTFPALPRDVDWLSGAALVVDKFAFDAVGGFDEGLRHGLEDADVCRRLWGADGSVVAVPSPPVVHVSGTSGYQSDDPERAKRTLIAGLAGWCRYSRRYHGPVRRRLQQAALLAFVGSRFAYFLLRTRLGNASFTNKTGAYRAAGQHVLHDAW